MDSVSDEALTHRASLAGPMPSITLEIDVEVNDDIPKDKVRIVRENCKTLANPSPFPSPATQPC